MRGRGKSRMTSVKRGIYIEMEGEGERVQTDRQDISQAEADRQYNQVNRSKVHKCILDACECVCLSVSLCVGLYEPAPLKQ